VTSPTAPAHTSAFGARAAPQLSLTLEARQARFPYPPALFLTDLPLYTLEPARANGCPVATVVQHWFSFHNHMIVR
jgi:hypothetical protein